MANVIGINHPNFQDRGYVYQQPTKEECRAMGWHVGSVMYNNSDRHLTDVVKPWLKETFWWQDYALFPYGIVYFKHERDLLLFKLRWDQ